MCSNWRRIESTLKPLMNGGVLVVVGGLYFGAVNVSCAALCDNRSHRAALSSHVFTSGSISSRPELFETERQRALCREGIFRPHPRIFGIGLV